MADEGATLAIPTKAEHRREAQARRSQIHEAIGAQAGRLFRDHGLRLLEAPPRGAISAYWPIRSEPDPRPLLVALAAAGLQVTLPVIVAPGQPLRFHAWQPGDDLVAGPMGTMAPRPETAVCVPEIMLVPFLAFDRARRRLGYGGGFYDRTIAGLRATGRRLTTIGIGYAGLEIDEVPTDPWDQTLDAILTEAGWV